MDKKEQDIYIAFLIAAVVVGAAIVIFIITILRQKKLTQQLYMSKINAEIKTLESMKASIATTLYDDIAAVLVYTKYILKGVNEGGHKSGVDVELVNNQLDLAINRLKKLATGLVPEVLLRKGWKDAFVDYLWTVAEKSPIQIDFDADDQLPELEQDVSIHVFRILQELVKNTLHHAQATRLDIRVVYSKRRLMITLEDDGVGFDKYDKKLLGKGSGIKNILSRLDMMKGELVIDTKKGAGAFFLMTIPVE